MKKIFKVMLVFTFICLALLSVTATAADIVNDVKYYEAGDDGTFSLEYAGDAGEFYALLVVRGVYNEAELPEISEDSILYIDQATADEEGTAEFTGWIPKTEEEATVYIGGVDDGPVLLGYVNSASSGETRIYVPAVKGDKVYLQDGTIKVANATGGCLVPTIDGIVVVNTGMETQQIYEIDAEAGTATATATDAVLGTKLVSVRYDEPSGIRFKMTHNPETKGVLKEYGFIMTVESSKVIEGAGEDYVLDKEMVEAGFAKQAEAWKDSYENNGKWFDISDDTKWIISGVLYGIPMNKTGVQTMVVSRPYAIYSDDTYVYGETTKMSLYDACKIKEASNFEGCTPGEILYMKRIIEIVDGTPDVFIDVSRLYP